MDIKLNRNRKGSVNLSPFAIGLIFFLIFGGAGIFVIVSYFNTSENIRNAKKVCTETTTAVVVSVRTETRTETTKSEIRTKNTYKVYFSTLQYTAGGKDIVTEREATRSGAYYEGQKLTIMYNPNNPEEYYITGIDEENSIVAPIVGAVVFVIGLAIFIVMIKVDKKRR